jgi:hypothetical protein
VKAMERSTASGVSWYKGESRLEAAWASTRSTSGWRRRFPIQNDREKLSLGAPDHAKEGETREGTWLTGFMPKLKDHHGGRGVLRRAISSAWRWLERGKETRSERGSQAICRCGGVSKEAVNRRD